jgi:predicted ABC-type ATPase
VYEWITGHFLGIIMPQKIVIVGGANGAGKTTFAYQYKDEFNIDYLGADEIAEHISRNKN